MPGSATHHEGCLLGVLLGDSLGSVVENASARVVEHRHPSAAQIRSIRPGPYGSTTEMTVALAESLVAHPEFDGEHFAARLLARRHDARGYGQGTTLALERLRAGATWEEAGTAPAGRGCYGNAAAARSASVGLVHGDDVGMLRWVAEEAAGVTHTHSLGVEGAVLLSFGVALAVENREDDLDALAFFETLAGETQVREYRTRIVVAAGIAARAWDPALVVERLGNNQSALGSVVTALLCFAAHADDFVAAMSAALRLGGNATAIAAMTGALSGAHLGREEIPADWVEGLEKAEISAALLARIAGQLAAAAR
jgi:ADP-ribosylglycohydrolase